MEFPLVTRTSPDGATVDDDSKPSSIFTMEHTGSQFLHVVRPD
jgi:hypothetical protein